MSRYSFLAIRLAKIQTVAITLYRGKCADAGLLTHCSVGVQSGIGPVDGNSAISQKKHIRAQDSLIRSAPWICVSAIHPATARNSLGVIRHTHRDCPQRADDPT